MHRRRGWSGLVLLGMLDLASGAGAQVIRFGGEFQVNNHTPQAQVSPAIALDADGDFVVAWTGYYGAPGVNQPSNVFARRFSSAGVSLVTEFQVNVYTSFKQRRAAIAVATDGDFVVTWESPQDGSQVGVFARRFSSAGTSLAGEFHVNTATIGYQEHPTIAASPGGGFVIAWSNRVGIAINVAARRFSSSGTPLGVEFQVGESADNTYSLPAMANGADGDFVVTWVGTDNPDNPSEEVLLRRFSSAGTPLGGEIVVNEYKTNAQFNPVVASAANGDFVVMWLSWTQDGEDTGVFGRRVSGAGTPIGGEFQVNTYTHYYQRAAAVAARADGDFIVVWSSREGGATYSVIGRRFSSAGAKLAGEFQVNSSTTVFNDYPTVAMNAGGRFVVGWHHGDDVFAHRFGFAIPLDVDGNGSVDALTDLLLGLRYSFGFRGGALISGAVGAGCSRCDAPSIEAHLATLNK